jgi:hypothetical protein
MSNNIKNGQFRKLFLIIPFMCILSCWDNNDPNNGHHYYFEGIYPDLEIGRELILVYDGDTLTNKKKLIFLHME